MEFFPALLTAEESDQAIARIERHFDLHGFSLYAAELIEAQTFIGFIGVSIPMFDAPFMPAEEIGWRLAFDYWGRGLAWSTTPPATSSIRACRKGILCADTSSTGSMRSGVNREPRRREVRNRLQ